MIEGQGNNDEPAIRAHVDSGVCRFTCEIEAYLVNGRVRCKVITDCKSALKFAGALGDIDPFDAVKMPYSENPIFELGGKYLSHASCPLPVAVIKCIEVACGLALPRTVRIEFYR